jgi:hypothetical protein
MTDGPPPRKVSDLRCPSCVQPPVLLRTHEWAEPTTEDVRWWAIITCRGCRITIDGCGSTEQAAIQGVVGHWHWAYPQPWRMADHLAIRPGRP